MMINFFLICIGISGLIGYTIGKNNHIQRKYETLDINNTGERIVIEILKKHFPRPSNYLLNNITIANNDNGTTQIDHILINEYGVFIIETKHYSGWIFGKETDYKWTQSFGNGQKFQFLNPIKQNENHISQIRNYLRYLPIESFISIIVFTGEGEIKNDVGKKVVYAKELINHIKSYQTKKQLRLDEIHSTIGRLEFHRKEPSKETDWEHIQYVKSKIRNI